MAARRSTRFLAAYNRIEQSLREIVKAEQYIPFAKMLDIAKKNNAFIAKYEEDLREYAELRNAIVHHSTSTAYAIAEPHNDIVKKIEEISHILVAPVTVGELFRREVMSFQVNDSLLDVLAEIKQHQFTQFPIYDGKVFKGLITTVGITIWLSNSTLRQNISWEITMLFDILQHEKSAQKYRFISSKTSIYEAEKIFKNAIESGRRVEALLITNSGNPNQELIGIVTPYDMMEIQ